MNYRSHALVTLAACCCMLLLPLSHAVPSREQLQRTLSPAAALVESAWHDYYQELESVHMDGRPVMDLLGGFKQYGFTLTPYQLQRAYVNTARGARLRRLVRRQLLSGGAAHLKIGVIGTSVSWGTGPTERGTTDYVSMLPVALQMAFPQANVTSRNGCSPGTGSGFANMCLAHMLDEDVDLILMEFVTNDFVEDILWDNPHAVTYERLIRKALQMRNNPVIAFIQVPTWGQMFNTSREGHKPWPQSGELLYNSLSQYYGLPTLSFRNAWWHDAEASSLLAPAGWNSVVVPDQVHPNDVGHRSMLDMVMWLMMQTAIDLQITSMSRREALSIGNPLPAPMHAGNYEEATSLCILEEELTALVDPHRSQGWTLVNEGTAIKKKIGYVSTTAGSELHLTLDLGAVLGVTDFNSARTSARPTVGVALAYLQSYTNMGQAIWKCTDGCTCQERVFDAQHTQHTSTSFMALIPTNATAPLCKVVVRISTNTSSGGHKFKVNAIMVSRMQEMGFHWATDRSAEWKLVEWLNGEPM